MPQACTCAKTANVTTPDAGTMAPLPSANYLVRSTDCAGHRGIKNMTRLPFGRAPPPCLSTIGYSVWGLHIQKIHWHWRNRPSDDSALTIREIPVWRQDIVSPRDTLGWRGRQHYHLQDDPKIISSPPTPIWGARKILGCRRYTHTHANTPTKIWVYIPHIFTLTLFRFWFLKDIA
jgi:hypothetical protein